MFKLINRITIVLVFAMLVIMALPRSVFAASPAKFFQTSNAQACPNETNVFNLTVAFQYQSKNYYCVWFEEGSVTLGTVVDSPDGLSTYCPAGQPMLNSGFGQACITSYPAGAPMYGETLATATSTTTTQTQASDAPKFVKNDCQQTGAEGLTKSNCGIIGYLVLFINVLTAMVGVVIVLVIIVAGIQYASSRDDPSVVTAAKKRILNAMIALVSFIFMYAFLQWVVPGGVL